MTGFGEASAQVDAVHYAVELRSLNGRYFKANIHLPDELSVLEAELEPQLRKRLTRGSITLRIRFKDTSASAAYELNTEALQQYIEHLAQIEQHPSMAEKDRTVTLELGSLLSLPGVVQQPDQTKLIERCRPIILKLAQEACDKLIAMREREGQGLREDLTAQRLFIAERLESILSRSPQVIDEYHQKLRARVDELMARAQLKVDEVNLVREVAVFGERCNIAEEAQRLQAHLEQFDTILQDNADHTAGRTLDFLTQELLREANTIASKSNDASISRLIVEIKGAIDRIKEQVQNIE